MNQKPNPIPPESQTVEWKQSLGEWKEIVETCAAFATAEGGVIYVGISPKGARMGVQIGQSTLEDLVNKIKLNTDPPQFPGVRVVGPEMSAVIEIEIEENPIKPIWAFSKPMKRVGKTNQHINREESQRLLESSTGRTWDCYPCPGFGPKDIDKKNLREYLERAGMSLSTPIDTVVRNLKLPFDHKTYCNAAVLLFGTDPQRYFIEAQLKCGRFKGVDSVDFQDEQTYEGPILRQFENAMGFVGRNTRRAYRITGQPEREVIPEYPEDAVREAILNALCHRNYAVVGTIQIRIYDDRIEVWNPGHLPHDLSLRQLYYRHASHPGNPLIAQALYRARLIEHWGTGTVRIIHACKKANIKVGFETTMGYFIVTLQKKESVSMPDDRAVQVQSEVQSQVQSQVQSLTTRMLQALTSGELSKSELAQRVGRKQRDGQIHAVVGSLLSDNLVKRTISDKPNSRLQKYRITSNGVAFLKKQASKSHHS